MEHLTRQLDIIPIEVLNKPIHIVGAGAIGSHAALMLAKMGATNLTVYDFDEVSIENMNSQGYRFSDIGLKKVHALATIVASYTKIKINTVPNKVTKDNINMSGIVLLAADSMASRKELFEAIRDTQFNVTHVVDTRMGAEDALMYVMQPQDDKDNETYHKTLYTDQDAVQLRCTAKATIYTANMLAGFAVKAIKNILCKQEYPRVSIWTISENHIQSWKK